MYQQLSTSQKQQLLNLISVYLNNMPIEIAQSRYLAIQQHNLNNIQFALGWKRESEQPTLLPYSRRNVLN
ncbi:hypothetical protein [Paraglaciecola aquimarina]|uniref:hypothetical protein n=1 Tax=Paraglaciecola aquimarina TaxID=1235557 RepID=UPI003D17C4E6